MTPVRLRLRNFISYGDSAGELDFESFDVAVLSGGNGQGKSALLDAITWAVWGEARKAAGAAKPDEELLRSGAREMSVEFTFDLEGERYRVLRSYSRSTSGKSSRPGLDLQVLDGAAGEWRSLTAESVRATQAEIDRRVGIDYDTFINSAFLLQGRSDEFTRRRPAERKEVLGRILGLARYELLAAAAGERQADARERIRYNEEAVERLRIALRDEPQWKRELAETAAVVEAARAERDGLLSEEGRLTARRESLEADERRAARARSELQRLEERRTRIATEDASLTGRIVEAEEIVAHSDRIAAEHERFQTAQAACSALDADAGRHREISQQVHDARLAIAATVAEMEGRLQRAEQGVEADEARIAEDETRLAARPAAEAALAESRAAAEAVSRLEESWGRREALRLQREDADRALERVRAGLEAELAVLDRELADAAALPVRIKGLESEALELEARVTEICSWEEERARSRDAGARRKAERDVARSAIETLREEAAAIAGARDRLLTTGDGVCPTCGTRLTGEHRREVAAGYDRELVEIAKRISRREKEAERLHADCVRLADEFKTFDARIGAANGAAGHHAQVLAEIERLQESVARAREREQAAEALRSSLRDDDFGSEARQQRAAADSELRALDFDEKALQRAREQAAHVERWQASISELDAVRSRQTELKARVAQAREEIARLREDLARGTCVAAARARVAEMESALDGLGYDAARHEALRSELASLSDAPIALARLASAVRNLRDWGRRREELGEEAAACDREVGEQRAALDAVAAALIERPALIARLEEVAAGRRAADARLEEAQARLGGLTEKLAKAALDRALLETATVDLRQARHDATISKHLRQAFGAHGIPSLIIEETLPEVEDRANEILERLSDGRTRVALETTRETRAGGTRETLEIRITDEHGAARPYETYSGGEAFRVDFALRIALAQLLAERAGVRVRTLVIDEGFGTQDGDGLQGLVESIRAVQDDFDKILVITHLEELKDAFPVRIEVSKHPIEGSSFAVVGA